MADLRPYQLETIAAFDRAIADGARAPLLVLPTGAGKTVIAGEIIRRAVARRLRVLFLAPRRELVTQASTKLHEARVDHGVVMAGARHLQRMYEPVQVASIDTLVSRLKDTRPLVLPSFDVVVVDEAHLTVTEIRKRLLDTWPGALRIGLTATPSRKDGRALGALYDLLIEPTTTAELTVNGFLVPARYYSISKPDLSRVQVRAGDYANAELSDVMNKPKLVGDVVETWLARAGARRTVVFCCSIPHSIALCEAFQRVGVAAEHVDANTPGGEREEIFTRFRSGQTQVLTNCSLASYGFDLPELSCVVLARPTNSLVLYLQMVGRGLRIANGKTDCIVLDHGGCVHEHGFAADERSWTLAGDHALAGRTSQQHEAGDAKPVDCPECFAVFSQARTCPECGWTLKPAAKDVKTLHGQLIEIGHHVAVAENEMRFFRELRGHAELRGWKKGAAARMFKDKTGQWPPWDWNRLEPLAPSIGTQRWLQSRVIAFVSAKKAAQR